MCSAKYKKNSAPNLQPLQHLNYVAHIPLSESPVKQVVGWKDMLNEDWTDESV